MISLDVILLVDLDTVTTLIQMMKVPLATD